VAREKIDAILLNAYVDDELDDLERARIEQAAVRDPAIARQLALLIRLKSATAEAVEPAVIDLPRTHRRKLPLIAACVAAVIATATIVWSFLDIGTSEQNNIAFARAAHASWSEMSDDTDPIVSSFLARAPVSLSNVYFPDLSSAKLKLAHLKTWQASGELLLVAGFLGTRGCRVTMLVRPPETALNADEDSRLGFDAIEGLFMARWTVNGLSYSLIAEGMDRTRFDLIAKGVHAGSLQHAPIDKDMRMAIARSRATSPPCAIG